MLSGLGLWDSRPRLSSPSRRQPGAAVPQGDRESDSISGFVYEPIPPFAEEVEMSEPSKPPEDLESLAAEREPGLVVEFLEFLRENKKWWLLPILLVFTLFGLLMVLANSAAAPFIYTLF